MRFACVLLVAAGCGSRTSTPPDPATSTPAAPVVAAPPSVGPVAPASSSPSFAPVASTGPAGTDTGWAKAASGCGDFTLVVTHASKRRFLHVYGSRAALGLKRTGDTATIPLGGDTKGGLAIDVYPAPGADDYYCSDIGHPAAPRKTTSWPAAAGTIGIKLTRFRSEHDFILQLTLEGVSVRTEDGGLERIPDATYSDVHVGWLPG